MVKMVLQITLLISLSLGTPLHAAVYGQRAEPVAVGEDAPDITLQDQNGQKVTLSAAQRKSPVVLVFYRGYW
jgi:cytochrome oxidase Cu insertion factor (SCO1/SenC/PrrC family)